MPDPKFTKPWHEQLAWHDDIPHPDRLVELAVENIERPNPRTLLVRLAPKIKGECFCQFTPGQYVEVWVPDTPYLSRSYSIGNAPREDGSIDLQIRQVEGGRLSEWAFNRMKRGDTVRVRGMTLLARRSGLDVHGREDAGEERTSAVALPPRSALPFLITIELLLIERAVLAYLYQRLSRHMPSSVDELLTLQREVLDALEEYYGAITSATRFSDAVTTDGEVLLGLGDLYDAVLAWTVGASVVTALFLVLLLRGKVE